MKNNCVIQIKTTFWMIYGAPSAHVSPYFIYMYVCMYKSPVLHIHIFVRWWNKVKNMVNIKKEG